MIDLRADHLRQNRPCPFGADRNCDGRPVDECRREEIAIVRLIHGICGDFPLARRSHDNAVKRRIAGCGKDEDGAFDLMSPKGFAHGLDIVGIQKSIECRFRAIRIGDDARLGVQQQP